MFTSLRDPARIGSEENRDRARARRPAELSYGNEITVAVREAIHIFDFKRSGTKSSTTSGRY